MPIYGNSRPQFTDSNGDPIQAGKLYIGMPDQDPVANPLVPGITDLDDNLITNPLTLNDEGVPTVAFKVDGDYSQAVFDSNDNEIAAYQIARTGGFLQASDLVSISGQFADWNADKTYSINNFVRGSNDLIYKSLTNNNLGNDPTSTSTAWSEVIFNTAYNSNETYSADEIVRDGGLYYKSRVDDNQGNTPSTSPDEWLDISYANVKSGRKNSLINPRFMINQEEVSGTVTLAAGEYGHDGYRGGASGCTYTFAESNEVTTLTITAGTLEQEIEAVNINPGVNVLSWSGTAQGRIDSGSYGDSGEVLATLDASANVTCEWGTGTLTLTQLEKGYVPTECEYRFHGEDLAMCQTYFFKSGSSGSQSYINYMYTSGPITIGGSVSFPVTMRAVPTITYTDVAYTNGTTLANQDIGKSHVSYTWLSTAAGGTRVNFGIEADARL